MKLFTNSFSWMVKNFDLISIIVATCLTWISRFDFSKSVTIIVRDQLSPEALFPINSFVTDYPNGSLNSALHKFRNHNIILVYSYSHWDAESVLLSHNIEKVAEAVQYKVPIISVNCWDNNSNCFDVLRPNRFPQLMAYVSNSYFIEYKRSIEPIEIFDFISSIFYPFHFPKSLSDLGNLIKSSDASFIICLNSESSGFSRRIRTFHKISSIYKGESYNRPNIAFIVLSESDGTFSDFRHALNISSNEAVLYNPMGFEKKYNGEFFVKDVLGFLKTNNFRTAILKYSPSGVKSLNLQEMLRSGFVIFYVYDESQRYLWENIKSRFYFQSLAKRVTACSKIVNASELDYYTFQKEAVINQYLNYHKDNLTCQLYFNSQIYSNFSLDILSYLKYLDLNHSSHFSNYLPDPFVAHSAFMDLNWNCRKHLLMRDYEPDDVSKLSENIKFLLLNPNDNSSLLPCSENFNRSISFAEMDGEKFSFFLKQWGLPSTKFVQPQIVVVDWKNEIIHNMQPEISETSLNHLVNQLVINNLTSHLKSEKYVLQDLFNGNFYPIDVVQLERELNDPETDLIVFYYTPWCSYCSSIMHLLIMLGRYFKNYPKLHFTSLDTFNNDLPYKYQSEQIPALIMFPRGKKSDSFVFPITDKAISLSSLVRFVLENSGDVNLNLNNPSLNYNNEYNITCNRLCLESAEQSIDHLLTTLTKVYTNLKIRLKDVQAKIETICSSDEFHWFLLKVEPSNGWFHYRLKQYRIQHTAQLVEELNVISRKKHMLHTKVLKLAKLKKAIVDMHKRKLFHKSVQSLAIDILNFSI